MSGKKCSDARWHERKNEIDHLINLLPLQPAQSLSTHGNLFHYSPSFCNVICGWQEKECTVKWFWCLGCSQINISTHQILWIGRPTIDLIRGLTAGLFARFGLLIQMINTMFSPYSFSSTPFFFLIYSWEANCAAWWYNFLIWHIDSM